MEVVSLRSSFSLSLVAHALFVLLCALTLQQQARLKPAPRTTWIEVAPLSPAEKKKSEDRYNKQIVQTEKGRVVDKAAPDSFLGARTQIVDRQTVSKNRVTEIGKESSRPAAPTQARAQARAAQPKAVQAVDTPTKASPFATFGVALPKPQTKVAASNAEAEAQEAASAAAGSPQDYVKGLNPSDRTALNTREYIFYGYFQRIRERLDRAWVPILRERLTKLYKSGRHLANEMDHATRVLVVLDKTGEIVKVQVLNESGTKDLDDAAVAAFNRAGPFPNPPRGIVEANGEIRIPWEFILRS